MGIDIDSLLVVPAARLPPLTQPYLPLELIIYAFAIFRNLFREAHLGDP